VLRPTWYVKWRAYGALGCSPVLVDPTRKMSFPRYENYWVLWLSRSCWLSCCMVNILSPTYYDFSALSVHRSMLYVVLRTQTADSLRSPHYLLVQWLNHGVTASQPHRLVSQRYVCRRSTRETLLLRATLTNVFDSTMKCIVRWSSSTRTWQIFHRRNVEETNSMTVLWCQSSS